MLAQSESCSVKGAVSVSASSSRADCVTHSATVVIFLGRLFLAKASARGPTSSKPQPAIAPPSVTASTAAAHRRLVVSESILKGLRVEVCADAVRVHGGARDELTADKEPEE
ncbi:hypothetical protein GCM10007967_27040 [Xylanimonas ulmi]